MNQTFKMWLTETAPADPLDAVLQQETWFTTARSSGPGGQNVNRVESKAILWWIPAQSKIWNGDQGALARFQQLFANSINNNGECYISSQVHRDQPANKRECMYKLKAMIQEALTPPPERIASQITPAAHQRRIADKTANSQRKAARRFVPEYD